MNYELLNAGSYGGESFGLTKKAFHSYTYYIFLIWAVTVNYIYYDEIQQVIHNNLDPVFAFNRNHRMQCRERSHRKKKPDDAQEVGDVQEFPL